jgi:nitroimidazol reductase NimA-like FMN-containing flavoprotein (pyridoxamine 5'-phosphate oxidase superfamily)
MKTEQQPEAELDAGGLDDLDVDECWQLLTTQPVGRVGVIVDQYPVITPVNYALDGKSVVFRSGAGAKMNMIHGSKVTFEVDQIDPVHHTGWSVLIKGIAQGMNVGGHRDLADRAQATGAEPWAPGDREYLVRIRPDEVTGRRVHGAELPPSSDLRAYM